MRFCTYSQDLVNILISQKVKVREVLLLYFLEKVDLGSPLGVLFLAIVQKKF